VEVASGLASKLDDQERALLEVLADALATPAADQVRRLDVAVLAWQAATSHFWTYYVEEVGPRLGHSRRSLDHGRATAAHYEAGVARVRAWLARASDV
jgi:hypothetical protein